MIASTVVRSLNTGMTTDSSGSAGTARVARGAVMEPGTVPQLNRLVVVAPNWLGDAVMALPAIEDVRRASPPGAVAIAAPPELVPLFSFLAEAPRTVTLDRGDRKRSADRVARLREGGFEAALLLPNSFQSAMLAWRAGIPERWGYRADGRAPLLTRGVHKPARGHQSRLYQHLVSALGFPAGPPEPRLIVPPGAREAAIDLLARSGWDGRAPLCALAPGAAYGGAKRWPAERFGELAAGLAAEGVGSVLVGAAADSPAVREVAEAIIAGQARAIDARGGPAPISLAGQTDLAMLAGVLQQCRALVSNDSGAMHFAAALGVPVTALFGPTDERQTHPIGRAGGSEPVVIASRVWCRPCMLRECPLTHRCMRTIGVARVLAAARQSMR
jgi:heptosyltransferase-2